jgi:regulator of cell morphogenesis and NO signaling
MNYTFDKTIGEIVAEDYRTATVFQKFDIDFCCKGNRSLAEACENQNIDLSELLDELQAIGSFDSQLPDYNSWPIDLLTDYIEKKHHRYVNERILLIQQYLDKLCQVHGKKHHELFEIRDLFLKSASELTVHMKKEEFIIFPFVRKLMKAKMEDLTISIPPFGTVANPIEMMKHDHSEEGDRFRKISLLSNHYQAPADGCNTYKVTYSLLKEFEEDLHLHIHLENNVLFPKAIELEKSF